MTACGSNAFEVQSISANVNNSSVDDDTDQDEENPDGEAVSPDDIVSTSPTLTPLTYIGPGGGGVHTDVAVHPSDSDIIFVGTDVAGIFRSLDRGVSFKNISHDLENYRISDIEVVEEDGEITVYTSTAAGVYKSEDLGDSWESMNEGFSEASVDSSLEDENNYDGIIYPIHVFSVDPYQKNKMYAGVGIDNVPNPKPFVSDYKVYKWDGSEWQGILDIDSMAGARGATVYSIHISPEDCTSEGCPNLYVGTDKGFYYSPDFGDTFYSFARPTKYVTHDEGSTWIECTASTCPDFTTSCSDASSNCLPLTTNTGETLPNVRAVQVVESEGVPYLYTSIFDTGHMDDTCSDYISDADRDYAKGGLYRSIDGGQTWENLYQGDSTTLPITLRCSEDSNLSWSSDSTVYLDFIIDEEDPNHYIIFADGPKKGVFEFIDGDWRNLAASEFSGWGISSVCNEKSCFEGERGQGLWSSSMPYVLAGVGKNTFNQNDPIYFGGGRILNNMYLSGDGYYFDNLSQDFAAASTGDNLLEYDTWQGTGVDDSCAYGGLAQIDDKLFLAMGDYGEITSYDGGESWFSPPDRANWSLTTGMDGRHIIKDPETEHVYLALVDNDYGTGAVYKTEDLGMEWIGMGGSCDVDRGMACLIGNNLDPDIRLHELAIDYSSSSENRRILAGSNGDGLFIFDPSNTSEAWSNITGTGCPDTNTSVYDIYTDSNYPQYAIVAVQDENYTGQADTDEDEGHHIYTTDEGIYIVNLADLSCERLYKEGADQVPVYHPHNVSLSKQGDELYVVASGEWWGWPVIHRTKIDFEDVAGSVDWSMVTDFYYKEDGDGERVSRTTEIIQSASDYWWDTYLAETDHEAYQEHYQLENFKLLSFHELVTNPSNPNIVIAGMMGEHQYHRAAPKYVYISVDAGKTFEIMETMIDVLPTARISRINFNDDGETAYISLGCSSVFKIGLEAMGL